MNNEKFGKLSRYVNKNGRVSACPVSVLIAIEKDDLDKVITPITLQCLSVFSEISFSDVMKILKTWEKFASEYSLSMMSYIASNLAKSGAEKDESVDFLKSLKSRISDKNCMSNYEDALGFLLGTDLPDN